LKRLVEKRGQVNNCFIGMISENPLETAWGKGSIGKISGGTLVENRWIRPVAEDYATQREKPAVKQLFTCPKKSAI